MEQTNILEKEEVKKKKSPNGDNIEEITIRLIKFMLKENVPMEDIQHITKKSVEEIRKIGELSD